MEITKVVKPFIRIITFGNVVYIVMGVFISFFTATAVDPFLHFVTPADVLMLWFGLDT